MERKEAIEVIKKNWPDSSFTMLREALETLIPELKESEDERIRNFLIKQANSVLDSITDDDEEVPAWKSALAWLEKQGNLMKALQISNAKIGELIEENYYLKEQLEKQRKNNMGISEATKQELENNLNKALEKEIPESCNEFLDEQGEKKSIKEHNACEFCEDRYGCVSPCSMKLIEEQKPAWSEEDELNIRELESLVKQVWATAEHENDKDTIHKMSDLLFFLKTLKPQPKQEWSDVDKDILFRTIDNLKFLRDTVSIDPEYAVNTTDIEREITWLKSLKERYTWRPSDEQISIIEFVMEDMEKDSIRYAVLNSVLEQLKKLREE